MCIRDSDKGESKEDITNKILEKYQGEEEITASDIDDVLSDIEELKKDGKLFRASAALHFYAVFSSFSGE